MKEALCRRHGRNPVSLLCPMEGRLGKREGSDKMRKGDVSFSFLNRVEEVERNIGDGRWQSALALAVTLPDICGGVAFPDIVKKYRDGRVMLDRQKKPSRDVGAQYIRWFDEYAADFFKVAPKDREPYICGERCWQLRCEYLHQNKGFLNHEGEGMIRFHLGIHCGTSICHMDDSRTENGVTDIRIDIEQFCVRMCRAAKKYYYDVYREKDFSIYNTPVLDFIQVQKGYTANPLLAVVCSNRSYGEGLCMALEPVSTQIQLYENGEEARKKLGKRKPVIWILTEEVLEQEEQPWTSGKNRPVIILARNGGMVSTVAKREGKVQVMQYPIRPENLRNTVLDCLK